MKSNGNLYDNRRIYSIVPWIRMASNLWTRWIAQSFNVRIRLVHRPTFLQNLHSRTQWNILYAKIIGHSLAMQTDVWRHSDLIHRHGARTQQRAVWNTCLQNLHSWTRYIRKAYKTTNTTWCWTKSDCYTPEVCNRIRYYWSIFAAYIHALVLHKLSILHYYYGNVYINTAKIHTDYWRRWKWRKQLA